ncbi:MAG TPA: cytochrome bc complex cytochrome b subunit, partial [Gaiellales bacterium]|nr:cytochrome bc complex cytochrome b subunit [Gaiellales bacterium]
LLGAWLMADKTRGSLPETAAKKSLRYVDDRLGSANFLRRSFNKVFPDHWSFLLGEIALYSFVILLLTGVYLTLFFHASSETVVYHGSYAPLRGVEMTDAYASTLHMSFDVRGGLLMRQIHHWAAILFVCSIAVHMMRVFFTGAFRKPRTLNWVIGVTLFILAVLEGFAGYSLPDDLLSGMGLAIAYSVVASLPLVGGQVATLVWDGPFPGSESFEPRLFIAHVFIVPALLATLIGLHLAQIIRQHHSQFRGPGRREDNVVGTPLWPGYALRSLGWMSAVAAVLFLLGGLVQINPIWQWGPFEPYQGTNGAQPDWYLGWLIGALRLMPNWEPRLFGHTIVPNPFFGGVLFPGVVFAVLYSWPWLEERFLTRDLRRHDLLDRPRDSPWRTAIGAAFFTWVLTIFIAGAADRLLISIGFSYEGQVWFFRFAALLAPLVVGWVAYRLCRELRSSEAHPLRGWTGQRVTTDREGRVQELPPPVDGT